MTASAAAAQRPAWYQRSLIAIFVSSFLVQVGLAVPYVTKNGPASVKDFFVGDIWKTLPGRFAMVDLTFVVIAFHFWAVNEARSLGIMRWWLASLAMTFGVGIASAIPFFLLARERVIQAAR